ncbi:hypothetical protein PHYSODRAFT_317084 [Phytophthora sojae]|uniref:RxLR effector protein n=2 Tax=Phytophthora sojae TaxID=67593 RepID=G4ZVP8_PHYSP|nr:hypothetical protein PHYSODRAFT_317084 [Phytophthora sojae]AEK80560.1 Avh46 [Phytophthora sojae]AEK80561.1 Avh46 [Phytophthora sojae]AEK80562.1 Avh46 [Phytophthora sojae]EGZ11512.1 hypothetical protein PHYSODRAFT_317084 [Phytophthora sojae]|eukprot:XP_009531845.1 hypothetical protein PHYSODRAFT_317084 [Phytophthora sojae]
MRSASTTGTRLTYIIAAVSAATLHVSGAAPPTIKDSNSNLASTIGTTEENGDRMLRKVKEGPVSEENDEERTGGALGKWFR